jgi:hypothetical protein
VDVNQALSSSLVLVEHLLAHTNIQVERALTATRLVPFNRQELQRVLINLMINAIQAMPEGGTLTLRTADSAETQGRTGVLCGVCDTGAGLSDTIRERLFSPFFTTKNDGNGLGLWISVGWSSATAVPLQLPTGAMLVKTPPERCLESGCRVRTHKKVRSKAAVSREPGGKQYHHRRRSSWGMDDRLECDFATIFVAISLYSTWAGWLKSLKILLDCLSRRRTAWLSFSGSRRGRTGLVCGLCCVNSLVCAHTLRQPRVRPAPESPTARLGCRV